MSTNHFDKVTLITASASERGHTDPINVTNQNTRELTRLRFSTKAAHYHFTTANSDSIHREVMDFFANEKMIIHEDAVDDISRAVMFAPDTDESKDLVILTVFFWVREREFKIVLEGCREEVTKYQEMIKTKWPDMGKKFTLANANASFGGILTTDITLLPDEINHPHDSFYPFLTESYQDVYKQYWESSASVLILYGAPGCGKTTFLQQLCFEAPTTKILICRDLKLVENGQIFQAFEDGPYELLIVEEADQFLSAPENGNPGMAAIRSVTDGITRTKNRKKKIAFATNLTTTAKNDWALMRTGRCFAAIKFRELDWYEAADVYLDMNRGELPWTKETYGETRPLAEILNPTKSLEKQSHRTVGFAA